MRIDGKGKLFVGLKIDSKLREALAQATPGDRHYFEEGSPFLKILPNGEEQWIGKIVDGNLPPSEIEDIQRNVISILNRIAPNARHSPSSVRIFVVDETPGVTPAPPSPPPQRSPYEY
jgi:hypothetical protein